MAVARKGRDPAFTADLVGTIDELCRLMRKLLTEKHPRTGVPMLQYASRQELKPLRDALMVDLDKWDHTREQQGVPSQVRKFQNQIRRYEEGILELQQRIAGLVGKPRK